LIFALGSIRPSIQGWTSCMRRRFSSRRVVQERDACSDVCCAVPLLCLQSDYTPAYSICEIVCFISCNQKCKYN
jgi:hypothetical protein